MIVIYHRNFKKMFKVGIIIFVSLFVVAYLYPPRREVLTPKTNTSMGDISATIPIESVSVDTKNIPDVESLKVGQKVGSFFVKSVESDSSGFSVSFSGEVQISGKYFRTLFMDHDILEFVPNSPNLLPILKFNNSEYSMPSFGLSNFFENFGASEKILPTKNANEEYPATIIVKNPRMFETKKDNAGPTAELVKVVSLLPPSGDDLLVEDIDSSIYLNISGPPGEKFYDNFHPSASQFLYKDGEVSYYVYPQETEKPSPIVKQSLEGKQYTGVSFYWYYTFSDDKHWMVFADNHRPDRKEGLCMIRISPSFARCVSLVSKNETFVQSLGDMEEPFIDSKWLDDNTLEVNVYKIPTREQVISGRYELMEIIRKQKIRLQ